MMSDQQTGNRISFILIVMMLFFFSACSKDRGTDHGIPDVPADTSNPAGNGFKTYLALGDSYTIGSSVSMQERFPVQTTEKLKAAGVPMNSPEIIARIGWTTADLLHSLNSYPPSQRSYDFVTLLIGVNNQYQRQSQSDYRNQFSGLLARAIVYAGGRRNRVFVLSIPDYSVTAFALNADTARISDEIDAFNNINRELSDQAGVRYLDITPISREGRYDAAMQAADGLHPSGKQYERWAALLWPMMKAAL